MWKSWRARGLSGHHGEVVLPRTSIRDSWTRSPPIMAFVMRYSSLAEQFQSSFVQDGEALARLLWAAGQTQPATPVC
jgi:hypothetical protein